MNRGKLDNNGSNSGSVLIVDDDRDFADSLSNLLLLEGYDVQSAYSGAAALELLSTFEAEVALVDIRLGEESGITLVSEIKHNHPNILCIMMTAYASAETAIHALQEGAYDYICKPFYSEDLTATLERCFERVCLTREKEIAEAELWQAQKMKALGELTGGIAHDFNNLLTVILGNLELVADDMGANAKLRELIDDALSSVQSGKELTHRLLAFGRRQTLHPQRIDVSKFVAEMLRLFERTLGESIVVEHVSQENLWPIEADRNQLEMSLLNLVINAHHAMIEGGTLRIETAKRVVEHADASPPDRIRSGEYVLISITDTGVGMTEEVAAQAIQPFFTTKDVGEGSGLGLSMVYGFVSQSGGHFDIASEVGKGTTVRLYLPKAEHAISETVSEQKPTAHGNGANECILVVEDKQDVRRTARRMLVSLGYDVVEAMDADEALSMMSTDDRVDLLFTDIKLPGSLNGLRLARKAQDLYPDLKVLYTSGFGQDVLQHDDINLQQIDLIRKPFTRNELARRLRQSLKTQS